MYFPGGGDFLVIGKRGCAVTWGRIFKTGLTITVLHNNNYNGLGVLRGQRHILKKIYPVGGGGGGTS